ncbi:MAG: ATP-binding protein [Planctomycetota bacterium]
MTQLDSTITQRLTADDLAELITSFNEVTNKLQGSHDQLTAEVARLRGQLADANRELERSRRLAALGEMAAGIAHEIRNPLGAISLDAAALADQDDPDRQRAAKRIGVAVRSLDAIVNDVLAFSADIKLRRDTVVLLDMVEAAVAACVGVAGFDDVDVELHVDEQIAADIDCDQLQRALVNVVRNAIESMREADAPASGHRLTVSADVEGGLLRLAVKDTGPGIPADVVERIFNPFFTTRAAGTGLGLPIVHRILDAHGGRVEVEQNTPGPGTTITLIVPDVNNAGNAEAA